MPKFDETKLLKDTNTLRAQQEESIIQLSAQKFGVRYVDLTAINISTDALALIEEEVAAEADMAAFKLFADELHVAVRSPRQEKTQAVLAELEKKYTVIVYMASLRSLRKAWDRYDDLTLTQRSVSLLDISPESLKRIIDSVKKNSDVRPLLKTVEEDPKNKVTRMIEIFLGSAIATNSSDVHLEPQQDNVRLRYRQDGILEDVAFLSLEIYRPIKNRLKILSEMKLTNTHDAQDGRFTIAYEDTQIEIRSSTIPTAYGEGFVMRILDPKGIQRKFEDLGIEPNLLELLKKEIAKPNGMILTTGPTGSGKTTTLYSFLRYIYNPGIKVLTIEDPIEYHLSGINQTQTDHAKGYDFLSGLRAALRQDPDVIMVGEIRDNETAGIAVNASLTGHMVFSTLHTNNAAGVVPRLLDLKINPGVLAAALTVAIAQRLARRICQNCKIESTPTKYEQETIDKVLNQAKHFNKQIEKYYDFSQGIKTYKSPGCPECNEKGYAGRVGIYEVILMDENIEAILYDSPNERKIRMAAEKQGLLTMAEDVIIKVLHGLTDMEEALRVINIEDYLHQNLPITVSGSENSVTYKTQEKPPQTSSIREDINLLINQLTQLEDHQHSYPNADASNQLKNISLIFEDLLSQYHLAGPLLQTHNDNQIKTDLESLKSRVNHLIEIQSKNPTIDIQKDITAIKNVIAHMEQS